jgi:hypothetical protein
MKNIIIKGQPVLIALEDLEDMIAEYERLARIDEIKKAKVHGYNAHLKKRMAILTGEKVTSAPKRKRVAPKKVNIQQIDLSELKDFSNIEQYIVRR